MRATVAVASVVLLAPLMVPSPAAAKVRRCGHLPVDNGFPGVRSIRSEHVRCKYARRVARAVQRDWQETGGPVTITRANGRLWRCAYRERRTPGEGTTYLTAGCRARTNLAKRVTMKLVS